MPFKPINSKIKQHINQLYVGHSVLNTDGDLNRRILYNRDKHENIYVKPLFTTNDTVKPVNKPQDELLESELINNTTPTVDPVKQNSEPKESFIPRGWGQLDTQEASTPLFMKQPFNTDGSVNTSKTQTSSIKGIGEALFNGDGKDNAGNVVLPHYKKDKNGKVNLVTPNGIKDTLNDDINTLNAYKIRTAMGEQLSEDEAEDFYNRNGRLNLYNALMNPISSDDSGNLQSGWLKDMEDNLQTDYSEKLPDNYFDILPSNAITAAKDFVDLFTNPFGIISNTIADNMLKDNDNIIKSAMSKIILNGAETQVEADEGTIMRTKEMKNLIADSSNHLQIAKQLVDVTSKIHDLEEQLNQLPPSLRYKTQMQKELDQLRMLETKLYSDYTKSLDSARKLQTYSNMYYEEVGYGVLDALRGTIYGGAWLADKAMNTIGSIPNLWGSDDWWKTNLSGKWERINQGQHDVESELPTNISWADDLEDKIRSFRNREYDYNSLSKHIDKRINDLNNASIKADELIKFKTQEGITDRKDVEDWKNGYWGVKLKTDKYFDEQEQLVNQNGFDLFDHKTWLYGMPGLIGASNSSFYKTAGATAAKIIGGFATGGLGTVATAGLTSWGLDFSSAQEEADANVSQSGKEKFKQALYKKGLAYEFFKDGAEKLKNYEPFKNAKDENERQNIILSTYILDQWNADNPSINKEFANSLIGLTSMFNDTEMSTAGDAAIDAAIFVTPTRWISKLAKPLVTGLEKRTPGLYRLATKTVNSVSSPYTKGATIGFGAGLASTVGEGDSENNVSKVAAYTALGATAGVIPGLSKMAARYAFGTKLGEKLIKPALYMSAYSRPIESFLKRGAIGIASEQLEETTQNVIQNNFSDGYYDDLLNSNIGERMFRDFVGGAPIVADYWAGGSLNGLSNDQEMITAMNGATALTLPMFLGVRLPVMVKSLKSAHNAADLIKASLLVDKISDRSAVDQDAQYVARSKSVDSDEVDRLFGLFNKINKYRRDNYVEDGRSIPVDQELIDMQIKRFNHMKAAARNSQTLLNAEKAGIIPQLKRTQRGSIVFEESVLDNKDYQMYVAVNENLKEKQQDAQILKELSDKDLQTKENELGVTDLHKQDRRFFTPQKKQEDLTESPELDEYNERFSSSDAFNEDKEDESLYLTPEQIAKKDSLLSKLQAAFNLKRDYSEILTAAETMGTSQKSNYIAKNIQKKIDAIKKELHETYGISILNEDDINSNITDIEYTNQLNSFHRQNILDEMSVDNAKDTRRFFLRKPQDHIKKWLKVKKDDEKLQKLITKAFNEEMINRENASQREIVVGDTYVASDGKKYRIEEDPMHPGEYVKYEINPETNETLYDTVDTGEVAEDGMSIMLKKERVTHFDDLTDRLDYHNYKVQQEKKLESLDKDKDEAHKKVAGILGGLALRASEKEKGEGGTDDKETDEKTYDNLSDVPQDGKPHKINIAWSDYDLNVPTNENVEIEFWTKPWKNQPKKGYKQNVTARIYLKGLKEKGYFEIVINEYDKKNKNSFDYSLHFKPKDDDKTVFTTEDKNTLFDTVVEMIPDEATVSTYGSLTKGGFHGIRRLETDYGFKKVGQHDVKEKETGHTVKLEIYKKPKGLVISKTEGPVIHTEPTEQQRKTLDLLDKKRKSDKYITQWKKTGEKGARVHKSGLHYFIRQARNKAVIKFTRLHDFLDEYRGKIKSDLRYLKILEELDAVYNECRANDVNNKEGNLDKANDVYERYIKAVEGFLKESIEELEKNVKNEKSLEKYRENFENVRYYISSVAELRDPKNVRNIAKILSNSIKDRTVPKRAVIAGAIFDDIARRYIAGDDVKFEDYINDFTSDPKDEGDVKAGKETFNKIIRQIEATKKFYQDQGWILDTTPYTWHCTLPNGKRLAGETDMIAIKPNGNIVIIDFKTTRYDITTKLEVQITTVDPDTRKSTTQWEPYDEHNPNHVGKPIRETSEYINSKFGAEYTQIEEYIEQLTMYGLMVNTEMQQQASDENSPKVEGMQLFVLQFDHEGENDYTFDKIVGTTEKKDAAGEKYNANVIRSTRIDLLDNNIEGLQGRKEAILRYANRTIDSLTHADILTVKSEIVEKIKQIESLLLSDDNSDAANRARRILSEMKQFIKFLDETFEIKRINKDKTIVYERHKTAKKHLEDPEFRLMLEETRNKYDSTIDNILEGLQESVARFGKITLKPKPKGKQYGSGKITNEGSNAGSDFKPKNVNDDPIELDDEDTEYAEQYNNVTTDPISLEKIRNEKAKLSLLDFFYSDYEGTGTPVCRQEDFLKECTMFVTFEETTGQGGVKQMRAKVIFEYKGKRYGILKNDGSITGFVVDDGYNPYLTDKFPAESASAMCRNLRTKLYRIQEMQKEGLIPEDALIVVTGCSRTNGLIQQLDSPTNVWGNTFFFGENGENIDKMIAGEDSIFGVVGSEDEILGEHVIYGLEQGSNDRSTVYSKNSIFGENDEEESIVKRFARGTLVFLHKFRYAEDPEGVERTIPIAMLPDFIKDHEIKTIINLLKKGRNALNDKFEAVIVNKDGSRNRVKTKMTNLDVIRMLIRFNEYWQNNEEAGNKFKFGWKRFNNGTVSKNVLIITDLTKGTDENGRYTTKEIDVTNGEDLKYLYNILQRCRINANNNSLLRHGIQDTYSGSPFLAINELFKNDTEGNIDKIVLTDTDGLSNTDVDNAHLVFDREDFDKSYSGAVWMMKRGAIKSDFGGIVNPFISIQDVGILNPDGTIDNLGEPINNTDKSYRKVTSTSKSKKNTTRKRNKKKSSLGSKLDEILAQAKLHEINRDDDASDDDDENEDDPEENGSALTAASFLLKLKGESKQEGESGRSLKKEMSELEKKIAKLKNIGKRKTVTGSVHNAEKSYRAVRKRRLRKIFGKNMPKILFKANFEDAPNGGKILGQMVGKAIVLSDYLPEGGEMHEAFHYIMELIIPEKIKQKLVNQYNEIHGTNLSSDEVDELMADQYMDFRNNVEAKYEKGWTHWFLNLKTYIKELKTLNSYLLSALYVATDLGLFKYIKPSSSRLEEFEKKNGVKYYTLEDKNGNPVEFKSVDDYVGQTRMTEVIDSIMMAVINCVNIGPRGEHLEKIYQNLHLKDIKNLYSKGALKSRYDKKNKMSSWFKYISGFYINDGIEFTIDDAITFMENCPDEVYDAYYYDCQTEIENNGIPELGLSVEDVLKYIYNDGITEEERDTFWNVLFENKILPEYIQRQENAKTSIDQLNSTLKLAYELFTNWENLGIDYARKRLSALHMDVKRQRRLEQTELEEEEDENGSDELKEYMKYLMSESHDRSRLESASEQVLFILSTVPDERYKTIEDATKEVNKMISQETDPDKKEELKKNKAELIRKKLYAQKPGKDGEQERLRKRNKSKHSHLDRFMSAKEVSTALLVACHHVNNVQELISTLNELKKESPMFRKIFNALYDAESKSIKRYEDGTPKIYAKDEDGQWYIVKEGNYYYKTDDSGNIKFYDKKSNEEIKTARVFINHDNESVATQLFQYIKCQKLEFDQTYMEENMDEHGEGTGQYRIKERSGDVEYASKKFPTQWFSFFTGIGTNIFTFAKGKRRFTKSGKAKLTNAIKTIALFKNVFEGTSSKLDISEITDNNIILNVKDRDDLEMATSVFVKALNNLGIDVDVNEFKYAACQLNGNPIYSYEAFKKVFKAHITNVYSFASFYDLCSKMVNDLNLDINFKEGDKKKKRSSNKKNAALKFLESISSSSKKTVDFGAIFDNERGGGSDLYGRCSFISTLAKYKLAYARATKDLSAITSGNKKAYTMTECNSVSDFTDDINAGDIVCNGNKIQGIGSKILTAVIQYCGTCFIDNNKIVGSIIAKQLCGQYWDATNKKWVRPAGFEKPVIKLAYSNGSRVASSKKNGVSYTEQSTREDIISKMSILQRGGLIFPTLSDKATYFFLKGLKLAGFDYSRILQIDKSALPIAFLDNSPWYFDCSNPNEQIDLLIEYALCEREAIEKNLKTTKGKLKKGMKVANFFNGTMNAIRFGSLVSSWTFDEKGNPIEHRFDDSSISDDPIKAAELNLKNADKYFFNLSIEEQRKSMAYSLQLLAQDQLDLMEENGLIYKDKNGFYKNAGLDYQVIEDLASLYAGDPKKHDGVLSDTGIAKHMDKQSRSAMNSTKKGKKNSYAEHLAIIAYTTDIVGKSIQSEEETERFYTGFPQFFKWKYDKVNGKKILVDRYSDQSKRHGGAGSTGDRNRKDLIGIPQKYKCAEFIDEGINSAFATQFRLAFEVEEYRRAYFEHLKSPEMSDQELSELWNNINSATTRDEIEKLLKEIKEELGEQICIVLDKRIDNRTGSYTLDEDGKPNFYEADGAAYITPRMTENLLRMRGAFTDEVARAFAILDGSIDVLAQEAGADTDGRTGKIDYMTNAEAYEIVKNALIGSQKYSAYGIREMEGIPVHYYNKFALFPIFKLMTTGKTTKILEKMEREGVDMLLSNQAVKVGGCEPIALTDSSLQEGGEEFVTYEQDYDYIRRQMNTDPHEGEQRAIGTQVMKIALSAIESFKSYTLGGKKVNGTQLANEVMHCINLLADIGAENITNRFFDKIENSDGSTSWKFSIVKMSKFLKLQLLSRDADSNILNALTIVTKEVAGVLVKRFNINIESTSSAQWMESIIVSMINKEVVDVNTPGAAFYQRSIYGHEGSKSQIISDEMYDGKELKLLNEDGSMDAAISMDYFDPIFEAGLKEGTITKDECDTFEKKEKWLKDHGHIGENATATTISYRIPTQAQSSVHPLRFVAVIPVVRDTIMLPKEFVATTGSDFDIDKLYLFKPNFNAKKLSYEFDKEENKQKHYQNRLVFAYLAALKTAGHIDKDGNYHSGHSFTESYGAVDGDTALSKNVLKDIEKKKKVKPWKTFQSGSLAYQIRQKQAFLAGKEGIGPFALNNNSQILTQIFGVRFKDTRSYDGTDYKTILGCLNATSLANRKTKKDNLTLSWLSGFINAHVDVAKDPWIVRLNVTKFTWNLVNLLTRIGLDDGAMYYVAQPILKEMSKIDEANRGEYLTDTTKSESLNTKDDINELVENTFVKSGIVSEKQFKEDVKDTAENEQRVGNILRALLGLDSNGNYILKKDDKGNDIPGEYDPDASILRKVLTDDKALIDKDGDATLDNLSNDKIYEVEGLGKVSAKEIQYYVYLAYLHLDKYQEEMSLLVNTTKIDTKKQGKSLIEQEAYMSQYNQFLQKQKSNEGLFEPEEIVAMYEGSNEIESFINHKTRLATKLYKDIVSQFLFSAKPGFLKIHERILNMLGSSNLNKKIAKKVANALVSAIKSGFFYGEYGYIRKQLGTYPKLLVTGDNTTADKLVLIQNAIRSGLAYVYDDDGKPITTEDGNYLMQPGYQEYAQSGTITNALLKCLSADTYEEPFESHELYKFIYCEGALEDDDENANDIEAAWNQMLNDTETKFLLNDDTVITMLDFARELVAYAFITSADRPGLTKFFKYVPTSWRKDSGYDEHIENMLDLMDDEDLTDGYVNAYAREVIENNWTDPDFVKKINFYKKRKDEEGNVYNSPQVITFDADADDYFDYEEEFITYELSGDKMIPVYHTSQKMKGERKTKPSLTRRIKYAFAGITNSGRVTVYSSARSYDGKTKCPPYYLSARRDGAPSKRNPGARDESNVLYRLVYYWLIIDKDGNPRNVPVYILCKPKGKTVKSGMYKHLIYQYFDDSRYQTAYSRGNNKFFDVHGKLVNSAVLEIMKDYVTAISGKSQDFVNETIDELLSITPIQESLRAQYLDDFIEETNELSDEMKERERVNALIMLEILNKSLEDTDNAITEKDLKKLRTAINGKFGTKKKKRGKKDGSISVSDFIKTVKQDTEEVVDNEDDIDSEELKDRKTYYIHSVKSGSLSLKVSEVASKLHMNFISRAKLSIKQIEKDKIRKNVTAIIKNLNEQDGLTRKFSESMYNIYKSVSDSDQVIVFAEYDNETGIVQGSGVYAANIGLYLDKDVYCIDLKNKAVYKLENGVTTQIDIDDIVLEKNFTFDFDKEDIVNLEIYASIINNLYYNTAHRDLIEKDGIDNEENCGV